eukprot:1983474-Rhodomonas_salina.1
MSWGMGASARVISPCDSAVRSGVSLVCAVQSWAVADGPGRPVRAVPVQCGVVTWEVGVLSAVGCQEAQASPAVRARKPWLGCLDSDKADGPAA